MRRGGRGIAAAGVLLAVTGACGTPADVATPAPTEAAVTAASTPPLPVASPGADEATPGQDTPVDEATAAGAAAGAAPGGAAAAAPGAAAAPTYQATVSPITPEIAARMHASWRAGCPVPPEDLRYVQVTHHDMAGGVALGELVVHADVAHGLVEVFRALFDAGYPITSMRLVDEFGADDDASMAADNTSAFNCRAVTGGSGWSEHSYGRAIDVNPVENPYVRDGVVLPPAGAAFVDRPAAPGVIHDGDVVVTAFAAHGWQWGGHWTRPVDHQHFSTTGR